MSTASPSPESSEPPSPGVEYGSARIGTGHNGKRINLLKLAEAQRRLLHIFVVCLLAQLGIMYSMNVLSPAASPISERLAWIAAIISAVAIGVPSVQMAVVDGLHPVVGVLLGLVLAVPCLGFVLLASLNQRVNNTLQDAGVKIGLLGVNAAEMHKLRIGVCRGCGYDLRGLTTSVCPECGKEMDNTRRAVVEPPKPGSTTAPGGKSA